MPTAYVTAPPDAAAEIAMQLVEEGHAACVNRVACDSVYRWEDEIHEDDEVILLAKTTADGYEGLRERVVDLHPHEVPCVERFEEAGVLAAFADWRAEATTNGDDG
jgi:periplasmic divalent cation tolerance protein